MPALIRALASSRRGNRQIGIPCGSWILNFRPLAGIEIRQVRSYEIITDDCAGRCRCGCFQSA